MHSRKSIFYRGIVFIVSFLAMAIFSQVTVGAACGVEFVVEGEGNGTSEQYLTFGGNNGSWSDHGITLTGSCTQEQQNEFASTPVKVFVNGSEATEGGFLLPNFGVGHYTVEYRYKLDGKTSSIYRFIRILNGEFDTSSNYTLGVFDTFKENADTQIINAFYDSSNKTIKNFVVSGDATYLVITNLNGKETLRKEIEFSDASLNKYSINVSEVIRDGNKYYVIGNSSVGGVIKGITVSGETITDVTSANNNNSSSVYNGGYYDKTNEKVYLAGNDLNGNPIIDVLSASAITNYHTHTIAKGSYNSVIFKGGVAYAVGYTTSGTATKGLYSYVPETNKETTKGYASIFSEDAKFTKIIASPNSGNNIIIGETKALQVTAGDVVSAVNARPGYSDALILEVTDDALRNVQARLYGGSANDVFNNISLIEGTKYLVTGTSGDGVSSMVYEIDVSDFSATEKTVSAKSSYHVIGAVKTDYGLSYFGKILKNGERIIDVYYPKAVTKTHALLLVLDNRSFLDESERKLTNEVISLVKMENPTSNHYKFCYYKIKFNGAEYTSKECSIVGADGLIPSASVTPDGSIGTVTSYTINTDTGVKIIVYRTIVITKDPTPINLTSNQTGILKWYTYSRGYSYSSTNVIRLDPNSTSYILENDEVITYTADFKYHIKSSYANSDIFDMINHYINTGVSTGFSIDGAKDSAPDALVFDHYNQTNAAFASIEYAKMFAYYQEFSRVVKVNLSGSQLNVLGVDAYPGQFLQGVNSFYIYYIDYAGRNATGGCKVSSTTITNCTNKAGYAFVDLNSINTVIKDLLAYNNYFVSTRNTIYNGSIKASEVPEYKQDLYTHEYVKSYVESYRTATTNLTLNVYELQGDEKALIYQGTGKDVYFGLTRKAGTNEYEFNGNYVGELTAAPGNLYYYNTRAAYIMKNACYEIFYYYGTIDNKGTSKIFCLDNTPPKIIYHEEKDDDGVNKEHTHTATEGNDYEKPLYISSDFNIVNIVDVDDYAYIMVNRVVYPITCSNKSATCLADINEFVKQTFRYNKKDTTNVKSITFADRSGNDITLYFVVGTVEPSLTVTETGWYNKGTPENPEMVVTSFNLTINFYETNSIGEFQLVGLSRQNCANMAEQSNACFKEETEEEIKNTIFSKDTSSSVATAAFNDLVTAYIKAIAYRDRANLEGTVVITPDANGNYENKINNYIYKIDAENRVFIEVSGYEEEYRLVNQRYTYEGEEITLENNYFVRNDIIYAYEEGKIQPKEIKPEWEQLDVEPANWKTNYKNYYYYDSIQDVHIPNENETFESGKYFKKTLTFKNKGTASILNANNEFQFAGKANRVYRLVVGQTDADSYIEALPNGYGIEDDNTFRIDYQDGNKETRIIYTYNPTSGLIEYANPLAQTSNRITLEFTRTTKASGSAPEGGVTIPVAVPEYVKGTNNIAIDPETGLEIYKLKDDGEVKRFYLVDGIYSFGITQSLGFGDIPPVSASLYVTKLDLKLGYSTKYPGILEAEGENNYQLPNVYGLPLDFTGTGQENTVHLATFDNQFKYPMDKGLVPAIGTFEGTYFSKNTVFVGFTVKEFAIFTIKISKVRNPHGLPSSSNNTCQEIVILGSGFDYDDEIPMTKTCSNSVIVMHLPELGSEINLGDISYRTLKEHGIYELATGGGAYAFSGDNTFYEISLVEYNKETENVSTVLLKEMFYIDSDFDERSVRGKVSSVAYDQNGDPQTDVDGHVVMSEDIMYSFNYVDEQYTLYKNGAVATVGGANSVQFDFNFYDGTASDTKENRLLIANILVDGKIYTCNVFKAMTSANDYAQTCSNGYIDATYTNYKENGTGRLVFSASGDYKISFEDASKNRVIYNFVIDKSAPNISLDLVDGGNTYFEKDAVNPSYEIQSYVKNPEMEITIKDDLSKVTSYTYKFTYTIAGMSYSTNDILNATGNDSTELRSTITMNGATVGSERTPLINVLKANKYDGNIMLTVIAEDGLGNKTEKEMTVNFWADYSAPTFWESQDNVNVNKEYQTNEEIEDHGVRPNTITIFANDYVGRTFTCGEDGFYFEDPRYVSSQAKYTYVLECQDLHNTPPGSYPLAKGFSNTLTFAFYEVDVDPDSNEKTIRMKDGSPVEFQFGVPTIEGNARWIAIKIKDYVGNESDEVAYMPIIVSDSIQPTVVENGINKCVRYSNEDCVEWEPIAGTQYYLRDDNSKLATAYLSNSTVRVTMSEYIESVVSCTSVKYLKGSNTPEVATCEYPTGKQFNYEDAQFEFFFKADESDNDTFRIIRIVLQDFASLPSVEIVIVIDRINPEITFGGENGSRGNAAYIEYATENEVFDDTYSYRDDLIINEDQGQTLTIVGHEFFRYAPLLTYKNYKMTNGEKFEAVSDFTLKGLSTYYLLIDSTNPNVKDKECVAYKEDNKHCYVVDSTNTYYFRDLLSMNTKNNIQIWTNQGLDLKPITKISGLSGIAVYKIAYQVTDYAGNKSKILYREVFVMDTQVPDINLYDENDVLLYSKIATTNDDYFNGKITSTTKFVATDSPTTISNKAKVLFYSCGIQEYLSDPENCAISSDLLYNPSGDMFGQYNSYTFRRNAGNGVYKAFVYDTGRYRYEDLLYTEDPDDDGSVFVLTKNISTAYFVINRTPVSANFKIYGNKYTSDYREGSILSFEENSLNYIQIQDAKKDGTNDVRLMTYDIASGNYIDKSKTNAFGYAGIIEAVDEGTEMGKKLVTILYKDAQGRVVYEIKYKQADLSNGFMIHESYYYLNGTDTEACIVGKGESTCEALNADKTAYINADKTYVITGVVARIYMDGTYPGLTLVDNYGNSSEILGDPLYVDNEAYTENKDNNKPTGINYWFAVPSEALTRETVNYYRELLEPVYELLSVKPSDWEAEYQSYFVKEGTNFVANTSEEFAINTYYSRDYVLASDVNASDPRYNGNFNSPFFYAMASELEAKAYMVKLYEKAIKDQYASGYTFYDAYGKDTPYDTNKTEAQILDEIMPRIYEMVIPTYTAEKKFSDASINQKEYKGEISALTSTMYQYTYILRTRRVVNGAITYNYSLAGDTCSVQNVATQECIKVNLKIISAIDARLNINLDTTKHNLTCVSVNLGMAGEGKNADCTNVQFDPTKESTIVYIDSDVTNPYHSNVVYYGLRIYSESAKINYSEIGTMVPMNRITRYDNDHKVDEYGDYIWINSTWVQLSSIMNSNLYSNSCEFNGITYNDGCVFVAYASTYERVFEDYKPSASGNYYYNYYTQEYQNNKNEIISSVNGTNGKDVEFTYSDGGDLCTDLSCPMIPVYVKGTEIEGIKLNNDTGYEWTKHQNKKTYVELFNSKNPISRLFEISTTVMGGKFSEIYSYATLSINKDGEERYYNINSKIVHVAGYTMINTKPADWESSYNKFYTYNGLNYIPNTSSEWRNDKFYINDAFAAVIDIENESKYIMVVTDSAGNKIVLNISHTDSVPTLEYSKESADTNSKVIINVTTDSTITGLSNEDVNIYKYNLSTEEYELISTNNSHVCYSKLTSTTGGRVPSLKFTLNYSETTNCVGVYKIEVVDTYGNSNYKEVVFNPYVINNTFNTALSGSVNKVETYEDMHIIASNFFTIDINSDLNYVNIYKYPSYSNLNLASVAASDIKKLTIRDFAASDRVTIGTCSINIDNYLGTIYRLSVATNATHDCDGVFKIEIVNLFSDTIKYIEKFASLEGANELEITEEEPLDWGAVTSKYYYYDEAGKLVQVKSSSTAWEANKFYTQKVIIGTAKNLAGGDTIELDSIAPNNELLSGDDQYFNLYLDNSERSNAADTKALIESPTNTIEYTNTFVTIGWGGYESYSFASLYYKYKGPDAADFSDEWTKSTALVGYKTPFKAVEKFEPTDPGLHEYQFKFVDLVGNENAEGIYTIKITINPPEVGLFEVIENPITGLPDRENGGVGAIKVGKQYEHGERIPKQAILKCIVGQQVKDCTMDDYDYVMYVNNNKHQAYSRDENLSLPISKDSPFLWNSVDADKPEIVVNLVVSIKGKTAIATDLLVIIDRKAPEIEIIGDKVKTTYINSVTISLDEEDQTNVATIYKCDAIIDNDMCMDRLPNGDLVEGGVVVATIEKGQFTYVMGTNFSGNFMIVASDDPINLGNVSKKWFALDNEAPTIDVRNDLTSIAPYMYTNAESVKAYVVDELSDEKSTSIRVQYTAYLPADKELEATMTYNALMGLTKQGKYVLTPIDAVGLEGESITFYIYREAPKYKLSGEGNTVKKEAILSWKDPESELEAPIVSVTIDGAMYNASYNPKDKEYIGSKVNTFGEHVFVVVDAAGNRSLVMATINPTNNVCINGNMISVKRQANYKIDSLIVGGPDEGFNYSKDDVIIFALPSQATGEDCVNNGLLGYRTLDSANSHLLIDSSNVAIRMNQNRYDLAQQGFISKEAIAEVNNVGGTVFVFVVTKDIANHTLGYSVGTNFFMEDPLGWSMIFITAILAFIPGYRVFVKKKVRVI